MLVSLAGPEIVEHNDMFRDPTAIVYYAEAANGIFAK